MPHSKEDAANAKRGMASRGKQEHEFRNWLNQELKRLYDEPMNEPVPESLRKLLDELPDEDSGDAGDTGADREESSGQSR